MAPKSRIVLPTASAVCFSDRPMKAARDSCGLLLIILQQTCHDRRERSDDRFVKLSMNSAFGRFEPFPPCAAAPTTTSLRELVEAAASPSGLNTHWRTGASPRGAREGEDNSSGRAGLVEVGEAPSLGAKAERHLVRLSLIDGSDQRACVT